MVGVSIPYSTIKRNSCNNSSIYSEVSIPYSTIKSFKEKKKSKIENVSIPYSTIKSFTATPRHINNMMFQFLIVQLKVDETDSTSPYIKFQFLIVQLKDFVHYLSLYTLRSFNSL